MFKDIGFFQDETIIQDLLLKQQHNVLSSLADVLEISKGDLTFSFGAELEFYIRNNVSSNVGMTGSDYTDDDIERDKQLPELSMEDDKIKNIIHKLNEKYSQLGIESFEKEDGFNQFEVQFQQTNDALLICRQICDFRNVMTELCNVDFRAKPDLNDAGSSLHFHISIYYKDVNLFAKDHPRDDDEYHYLPLYWSIAGMLKTMLSSMLFFAPTENCYERYLYPKNQLHIHYPTGVCWGFNNRTCAIRIPQKPTEDPYNCRIEHRVSSSMCNPYFALYAILTGMKYGIEKQLDCEEPTFGNAFDVFHDYITPLPKSFKEAKLLFDKGIFSKIFK